jgi:MoaA/NifB/PqqE/SkfB family radical SAM enzyme
MPNLFDPTGQAKGLRLEPWYRAVKDGKLLPPVQAVINPVHGCNLACLCCELATDERDKKSVHMEEGHLIKLVDMLVKWGVKSITFGSVGEPTLHKELANAIIIARMGGMDVSVITNGIYMPEGLADAIAGMCSTIWFKIPAVEEETYEMVTRRRFLTRAINNTDKIADRVHGNGLIMGWLYEMTTLNFDETVKACKTAGNGRFDCFYARPLGAGAYGNRGDAEEMTNGIGEVEIGKIAEECRKEESASFRIRIDRPIPKGGFHQCYAAPLVIHLGADGNVYFCHDQYGNPDNVIGIHYPEPDEVPTEVWGGEDHIHLLSTDTPYWCEAACSLREYHRMARALVWEDPDPLRQWQIIR